LQRPTVPHLIKRFFGAVTARRLKPAEQAWVNQVLPQDLAPLFWQQAAIDQRHAYDVARRTEAVLGSNQEALTAALLHDVGKRHSDAGVIGRSLATLLDGLGLPLPEDWRRYRSHEQLGSNELAEHGADPLTVAFAAGSSPDAGTVDVTVWEALVAADDA
jgi:hypothetical protein